MSLFSLPRIAEAQFTNYLSGNFTFSYQKTVPDSAQTVSGFYNFARSFSTDELTYPAVIVNCNKLEELEPGTHVYKATLSIVTLSQIDDCANPVDTHCQAVSQIYDLMANTSALASGVNGTEFHLWNIYSTSYEQDLDRGSRDIRTLLEYTVHIQTLAV